LDSFRITVPPGKAALSSPAGYGLPLGRVRQIVLRFLNEFSIVSKELRLLPLDKKPLVLVRPLGKKKSTTRRDFDAACGLEIPIALSQES
jgi:hypothetical protein